MRVIAFANQKGGVGKTTSALNVGAGLAIRGRSVLLVDIDSQGNLTRAVLGFNPLKVEKTVYDLLTRRSSIDDVWIPIKRYADGEKKWPRLWLIPANRALTGAEVELASAVGRETRLKKALSSIQDAPFDYILIDCPPNLGILTANALAACGEVIVPVQTEFFAMEGMDALLNMIAVVREELNPGIEVLGFLLTMYDQRRAIDKEVVTRMRRMFGELVFETIIRENVSLVESPSRGMSIFEYKKDSYGAEDYMSLCEEIERRCAQR